MHPIKAATLARPEFKANPYPFYARMRAEAPVLPCPTCGCSRDLGVPGDGNALIMAAGAGEIEVMRLLLERGASIEHIVPADENPLIHASESGQAEAVRLLLDRGADVNARARAQTGDGRGEWRTALKMARRNGHQAVVRILLEAGARE